MNSQSEERMLTVLGQINSNLHQLTIMASNISADISDIAERLRDVAFHLDAEAGNDEEPPP